MAGRKSEKQNRQGKGKSSGDQGKAAFSPPIDQVGAATGHQPATPENMQGSPAEQQPMAVPAEISGYAEFSADAFPGGLHGPLDSPAEEKPGGLPGDVCNSTNTDRDQPSFPGGAAWLVGAGNEFAFPGGDNANSESLPEQDFGWAFPVGNYPPPGDQPVNIVAETQPEDFTEPQTPVVSNSSTEDSTHLDPEPKRSKKSRRKVK